MLLCPQYWNMRVIEYEKLVAFNKLLDSNLLR